MMSCGSLVGGSTDGKREILVGKRLLKTVLLEAPRTIDPQLNWKTVGNARRRAVRRARTSFTGIGERFLPVKYSKRSEDAHGPSGNGEIPVSESEKLGVNVLSRRFSDASTESIPIKKRRFCFDKSSLPSPNSSEKDESEEGDISSYVGNHLTRRSRNWTACSKESSDGSCLDGVDFSGILILASVACNTESQAFDLNVESSIQHAEEHVQERKLADAVESAESGTPNPQEKSEALLQFACKDETSDREGRFVDVVESVESSTPLNTYDKLENVMPCNEEKSLEPSSSIRNIKFPDGLESDLSDIRLGCAMKQPEATKEAERSDSRLHWDLNVTMDAWECGHDTVCTNSEPCVVEHAAKNGTLEKTDKLETDEHVQDRGPNEMQSVNAGAEALDTREACNHHDEKSCCIDRPTTVAALADEIGETVCQSDEKAEAPITDPDFVTLSCVIAETHVAPEIKNNNVENGSLQTSSLECVVQVHSKDDNVLCPSVKDAVYEDDDSQYEDGELRESGSHCWPDGGSQEVEVECTYYGSYSDYEDVSPAPLSTNSVQHMSFGLPSYTNGAETPHKVFGDSLLPSLMKCRSSNSILDIEARTASAEISRGRFLSNHVTVNGPSQNYEVDVGMPAQSASADGRHNGCDAKSRFTGWDRLPERSYPAVDRTEAAGRVDSSRYMQHSLRADVRSGSYERTRRSCDKLGRLDGTHGGFNRDPREQRSNGRSRTSQVDQERNSISAHQRSPEDYKLPMNAIAATVAKMENNGFVVAPDGTLVRAAGAAGHSTTSRTECSSRRFAPLRENPIESNHKSRVGSAERDWSPPCRYRDSRNPAGRYGPKDTFVRDGSRSFSPLKSSLYLQRSSNRSRSRSESPYSAQSPNLCRRSRSPNFRSECRAAARAASPRGRLPYNERNMRYSASRGRDISPHHPRQQNRSKYPVGHENRFEKEGHLLRHHERNGRYGSLSSHGRSRAEELYQPVSLNRYPRNGYGGFTSSGRGQDSCRDRGSRNGLRIRDYGEDDHRGGYKPHHASSSEQKIRCPRSPERDFRR